MGKKRGGLEHIASQPIGEFLGEHSAAGKTSAKGSIEKMTGETP